jgi:molybdopterin synthase sulfur carrier subunit
VYLQNPSDGGKRQLKVTVRLLLGELISREEEIELPNDSTIVDVLNALAKKHEQSFKKQVYDPEGKVRDYLLLLIDGRDISNMQGLNTKLANGNKVAIILPIGGG